MSNEKNGEENVNWPFKYLVIVLGQVPVPCSIPVLYLGRQAPGPRVYHLIQIEFPSPSSDIAGAPCVDESGTNCHVGGF